MKKLTAFASIALTLSLTGCAHQRVYVTPITGKALKQGSVIRVAMPEIDYLSLNPQKATTITAPVLTAGNIKVDNCTAFIKVKYTGRSRAATGFRFIRCLNHDLKLGELYLPKSVLIDGRGIKGISLVINKKQGRIFSYAQPLSIVLTESKKVDSPLDFKTLY